MITIVGSLAAALFQFLLGRIFKTATPAQQVAETAHAMAQDAIDRPSAPAVIDKLRDGSF